MKTVILTGVWNTGKAHAAALLQDLGIKMDYDVRGEPAAFEDYELYYIFAHHPSTISVNTIRKRDADGLMWGTKIGMFWNLCAPVTVPQLFRKPYVIVMQRDIAAVNREAGIRYDEIIEEIGRSLYWTSRLTCPAMHLSSELLFRDPDSARKQLRYFLQI
jgi:hypothetical protein